MKSHNALVFVLTGFILSVVRIPGDHGISDSLFVLAFVILGVGLEIAHAIREGK